MFLTPYENEDSCFSNPGGKKGINNKPGLE